MAVPELFQFSFSHYNEKVRWALDYKSIPHYRHSLLPGTHIPQVIWMSGQKQLPVLRDGQKFIAGSGEIIDHLEQRYPKRSLYPRSLHARKRALEIQAWFDGQVGAHVRRALFHQILPAHRFSAAAFSQGFSRPVRTAYRLMFPGLVPILKLDMRITRKGYEAGLTRTEEALDFIAEQTAAEGYMVGDKFSVADLTAASLVMPTCFPPELPFNIDPPYPTEMDDWLSRWRDHPGTAWIRRMYYRHRGSSAELTP